MRKNLIGLILGALLGWMATPLYAQTSSINITQSGTWRATIDCATQTPVTLAVDGATPVPVTVAWTGTGPYQGDIDYPATPAARTVGKHTLVLDFAGQSVTMADGTVKVYGAGTITVDVHVYPDTSQSPKILKWIRVAGTLLISAAKSVWGWLT